MKSIFQSQTFISSVCGLIVAIAGVTPNVISSVQERKVPWNEMAVVGGALVAFGKTVEGRIKARDLVYTPHGLPGPNKEDLE